MKRNNQESLPIEKKVENLLFYRKKFYANSTSSKILELLYPDKSYRIQQITSIISKKSYHYTKKIVLTLQSEGYLKHNSKTYGRSYSLTHVERWFAICILLDHISFQSLCILADAYSNIKNRNRFYLVSKFRDNFDKSHDEDQSCVCAIYSHRNISLSIKMLTDRNLAYWAFDGILKISPAIFEKLEKKYDQDLESLARWNYDISEKCKDEYLKNITFDKKKMKFLSLTSRY